MSTYAVVDPATGETVKEYPTITDDELRAAIGRRRRRHRDLVERRRPSPSAPRWSAASASCTPSGARSSPRSSSREMGKPIEQALGEVDFAATSTASTPTTPRS